MTTKRSSTLSPARPLPGRGIKAVAIPADRRVLIEAQVATLSATARRIAADLPLSADVSDFIRILDESGAA